MSQPAKTETGGWFSRLFGTATSTAPETSTDEQCTASKPPALASSPSLQKRVENAKHFIRHISPSPNNGSSRIIPTRTVRTLTTPASIIHRAGAETRKRQHMNNGDPPPVEDIFKASSRAKRFCGTANLSLVEEPIRITVPERLDMTWAGDRIDASPASSVRSLKSRLSGAASTTSSGLSSKTKAILAQLEKVHTPAKEAKRLPVMRSQTVTSERWNTASAVLNQSAAAMMASPVVGAPPPLRKTRTAVPTRLQLLSTNLGFNKTPYWKDIYRPSMRERDEASRRREETNGHDFGEGEEELNGSRLHPIFEIPVVPKRREEAMKHRVSVLKGTDGVSRNVFNTKVLDDEEEEANLLPLPKPVRPVVVSAPEKGFLGELTFKFEQPKEHTSPVVAKRTNGAKAVSRSFEAQSSSSSSSSEAPSSSEAESSEGEIESSGDEEEEEEKKPEPVVAKKAEKEEAAFAFKAPPAAASSWSCSECFVSNTGDVCVCCSTPKGGAGAAAPAPQRELVSNLASFAPKTTSGATFGFGVSAGNTATPTPAAQTAPAASASWSCPDCFVSATGDSCACCGYNKSGKPKELVSTFKPTPSTTSSTFSFGVGSTTPAPEKPAADKPLFGMTASSSSPNLFATSKAAPESTVAAAATTIPKITFGAPAAEEKKKEETWSCQACFINSTGDQCIACGTPKGGSGESAAFKPKELVSNLASFAPAPSSGVKFGFGAPAPAPAPTPASSSCLTSSSSSPSLFGQSKEAPKLNFGGFGATTPAPATVTEASKPLFGEPSSKPLFGSTPAPPAAAPEPTTTTTKPLFGAPTAAPDPSKPLFGASATPLFGSKPLFGSTPAPAAPVAAAETPKLSFGASFAAPPEAPKPMFGSLDPKTSLFGSSGAPKPSSEAPKPLFGSSTPSTTGMFGALAPNPAAAAAAAAPSLFSGFSTSASTPAFGAAPPPATAAPSQEVPAAKKPMFGNFGAPTASSTPAAPATTTGIFGQTNNLFGQSSAAPSPAVPPAFSFGAPPTFGAASSSTSLTSSASAGSLFNPSSNAPPTSFNFGASAAPSSNQPFVFGAAAPAPAASPFNFGAPSSAADGGFQSSGGPVISAGARKIAMARRRQAGPRR